MHPGQQRNDRGQEQVPRQLGHGRHAQHGVVGVDLPVGERRADDLRGVVDGGAEEQADRRRARQQRMRQVRIDEHAEQPEGDDVGDGVRDLALVGVDGRRRRHDGGDAADAGAGGNQRAQPRRQAEPPVEPGDEHAARWRWPPSRPARRPAPRRAISITLSLMPTSTMPSRSTVVVQNFRPGPSAAGSGSRLRSSRPSTMATGTPEIGLAPVQPARGQQQPADHVGQSEAGQHHDWPRPARPEARIRGHASASSATQQPDAADDHRRRRRGVEQRAAHRRLRSLPTAIATPPIERGERRSWRQWRRRRSRPGTGRRRCATRRPATAARRRGASCRPARAACPSRTTAPPRAWLMRACAWRARHSPHAPNATSASADQALAPRRQRVERQQLAKGQQQHARQR